jgi:hypothetical protein
MKRSVSAEFNTFTIALKEVRSEVRNLVQEQAPGRGRRREEPKERHQEALVRHLSCGGPCAHGVVRATFGGGRDRRAP